MEQEKDLNILQYTKVYMNATTIKIHTGTKSKLDKFREYKNESYDEVISKLIHIVKNPTLSKKTLKAIEEARSRYKSGIYVSEKEARRRLGL
jgi:hypothetical protein